MSLIKANFFRSVKFKIAAVYATLLTISFLAVLIVFWLYCRMEFTTLMDQDMAGDVERLSFEYLTGKKLPEGYSFLKRKDIKSVVRDLRAGELPHFVGDIVFENDGNNGLILLGSNNGKLAMVKKMPGKTAEVIEFAIPADSVKKINELNEQLPEPGRQYDYCWMCRSDGSEIIGSTVTEDDMVWLRAIEYKKAGKVRYVTVDAPRHRLRVAYRTLADGKVIAVGRSLHVFDSGAKRIIILYIAVAGGVLLLSLLCSYLIACRLCRGVDAVSAAADAIANGDYSRRVSPRNSGSEIDRMMINFNTMIGNTEKLMDELRTISDNIAHDLRTPLTRMLGRADLAVTGDMSREEYENAFAANVEECRRMLSLINTMLDITRTESGAGKLHLETFDMAKLLEQSVELFSMLTEEKNIRLRFRMPESSVLVCGDRMRLQQMLANLLDNAVKFTPENGEVDVSLQVERDSVTLAVRDNGCGMSEDDLQNVFKRFYRADNSRSLPGNGLGLSLVQAIVKAHNGSIEISSQINEGTVVWVTLPLAECA